MHALSRALLHRRTICLFRAAVYLSSRKRARIFGQRHVETKAHERDLCLSERRRAARERVCQPLMCVLPKAVALRATDVALIRHVARRPAEESDVASQSGRPGERTGLDNERSGGRIDAPQIDDAAGRITIES